MFLEINGKRVEVDDSFKNLPTDQQQAAVDHIASTMGQKQEAAPAPGGNPAGSHPYGDPIGGAALGAAVGATPYLTGKATGILKDVAKSVINDIKGTPATPVPPPSSLDAKLNTNLDKGTWDPPKFTPKGMPVDPNVPSDVYNWMAGQHSTVPVRGTNTEEADRLAKEWKAKQDAKAAFEKANPGRTLTDAGLDVSKEEAAAMLQKEEAKKAAELLEYRIKQKAAEKTAENVATETARMGARANIGKKLPVAGALGMANITDLSNRLANNQTGQAVISGIGTAGSVLPFVKSLPFLGEIPNVAKVAGTAGAVAAPFINMAIEGKAPTKEDVAMGALGLVGGPFIQGMMPGTVQAATLTDPKANERYEEGQTDILKGTKLPGYADGGDVKKPVAGIAGVYNQVGPVQGPNLSSIWAEHLASLPEKTAQNIMNTNTMVQNSMPYSFDPKKPLFDPNPNYNPQAAKDFANYLVYLAEGGQPNMQAYAPGASRGIAPYGFRHVENVSDVSLPKGTGWMGALPNQTGGISTEISADSNGSQYPLINPNMNHQDINSLLANQQPTDEMYRKAEQWAKYRQAQGKGPFISPVGELKQPLPKP